MAGEPTVPALVDAVEEAMDAAGLDTAHIVGNSMGGWIAAELAARGRARTVVAISPAGLYTAKELDYASRILRSSFAAAQRLAPHAERITATAAGRRLAFGMMYAHPERLDPGDAAYGLKVFAGSPSFLRTMSWIETGADAARPSLDRLPVQGRLGHPRPAAAGAPGAALGGHVAARRWCGCPAWATCRWATTRRLTAAKILEVTAPAGAREPQAAAG